MKTFSNLFSSKDAYSIEKENEYYQKSKVDTSAVDYRHLDMYIDGSLGLDFFCAKSVLDVGAGEGVYSAWIADRGGAKRVVGLELIEHRIRREYEQKLQNLKFVCGDIFNSDFGKGDEQFDVVFMNLVLHHLRFDLDRAIQILAKYLRPGGVFAALEPNCYSPVAVIAHILHARSANEGAFCCHTE